VKEYEDSIEQRVSAAQVPRSRQRRRRARRTHCCKVRPWALHATMLLAALTCKPALSGAASQCSASTCCRAALAAARASTPERAEFRRDDLDAWGLAGPVQLEKAAQVRPCGCKRALRGLQACSQRLLLNAALHAVLVSGALFMAADVVQQ